MADGEPRSTVGTSARGNAGEAGPSQIIDLCDLTFTRSSPQAVPSTPVSELRSPTNAPLAAKDMDWRDLRGAERAAAMLLGFERESWNGKSKARRLYSGRGRRGRE